MQAAAKVSATDDQIHDIVNRQVPFDMLGRAVVDKFNILFLYEPDSIDRSEANRIYRAYEL